MIEPIVFVMLFVVNFLLRDSFEYALSMNAFVSTSVMSIIFLRCFVVTLNDKYKATTSKYVKLCLLYFALIFEGFLASTVFSNFVRTDSFLAYAIRVVIYLVCVFVFIATKRIEFVDKRSYGSIYVKIETTMTIATILLLVVDILETPAFIVSNTWIVSIAMVLLAVVSVCSITISFFKKYWYHRSILLMRLAKLADNYKMNSAVIPPRREIESDYILQEAKYVLAESFIRPHELSKLVKALHDLMVNKGYTKEVATDYAGMFAQTLVVNLMKRKHDFSNVPNFIWRIIAAYDKRTGNRRH